MLLDSRESRKRISQAFRASDTENLQSQVNKAAKKRLSLSGLEILHGRLTSSDNPVERGLVASINRPGGNVTGVSWFSAELGPKRLGLLHELVPNATIVVINPNNPESARQPAELQNAAGAIGLQLIVLTATTAGDIDTAFTAMAQNRVGATSIGNRPLVRRRGTSSSETGT